MDDHMRKRIYMYTLTSHKHLIDTSRRFVIVIAELINHKAGSRRTIAILNIYSALTRDQFVLPTLCPLLRNRKSNLKTVNQTSHNFLWGWRIK